MKLFTIRLHQNQDIRDELQKFAKKNNIKAGFIVTCVGALKSLNIRMAGATDNNQVVKKFNSDFEIVSLVGTITASDLHLHISCAKPDGLVIGGHLKEGTIISTTAEIVIGNDKDTIYQRIFDNNTGFKELAVTKRP